MPAQLRVVMYHYVRNLPQSPFPRIKGMLVDEFVRQVDCLSDRFEIASLESALAFIDGKYVPSRDLCLLTFDDGVREHYNVVTPILKERKIQGLFFLITGCLANKRVAEVHKNHFLMASLPFAEYREKFFVALDRLSRQRLREADSDAERANRTYVWDSPEVARFKHFFNFVLESSVRSKAIAEVFETVLGDEAAFAEQLYLNWDEARAMQGAGMTLGGHTHNHRPIAEMTHTEMEADLDVCRQHLHGSLSPQCAWPFSYPYGKSDSFNDAAVERLRSQGYHCAFTTEQGSIRPGADKFRLERVDCKLALQ